MDLITGKSTLLNELFGTNFVEMDADKGRHVELLHSLLQNFATILNEDWMGSMQFSNFCRSAITKGVWLAKASGVEPLTIVMDLEGTDGRERGEVFLITRQLNLQNKLLNANLALLSSTDR